MKILIIIPAYNEEENILNTIDMIKKYKKLRLDYIVINDGSRDQTKEILEENNINHIDLVNNLGIGAAVQTGYKYAYYNNYDIAIQFDGDGQHDIRYIDKLVKPIIDKEADMVVGSRFVGNESKFLSTKSRRLGINILSFIIKIFTRKTIKDTTLGYRAVNRELIKIFSRNYPFDYPEPITNLLILKRGYRVLEIPVNMNERRFGKSSIRMFKSVSYMFNVIIAMTVINFTKWGGVDKYAFTTNCYYHFCFSIPYCLYLTSY